MCQGAAAELSLLSRINIWSWERTGKKCTRSSSALIMELVPDNSRIGDNSAEIGDKSAEIGDNSAEIGANLLAVLQEFAHCKL